MQNHENYSNINTNCVTDLRTDAPKASPTNIFYIDQLTIINDAVIVDYTLNDDWKETTLSLSALRSFALKMEMNEYCFDYFNGEHNQDLAHSDIDTYLSENLDSVVKAYLEIDRIGQVFDGITRGLSVLIGTLNDNQKGGLLCA